jgi:hypothetical protein
MEVLPGAETPAGEFCSWELFNTHATISGRRDEASVHHQELVSGAMIVVKRRCIVAKTAKKTARKKTARKRWSQKVTETSDAMTLEDGVFKKTPRAIALSLKRSAERSNRRKSSPFRSAMSMLTFYENRAGKNLSATRKAKIDKAKDELRALYDKAE